MLKYFRTPLFPSIDLSSNCNLQCIHCRNDKTKNDQIDYNKVIDLVNECEKLEVFHMSFAGGEPFLYPKIYDLLDYVQKLNIPKITVVTNCTILDRDRLKNLDKSKIRFAVSLDGPREIHNKIRGANIYDDVIDNVKFLLSEGYYVFLNCTLMKQNYKYFDEIIQIAKDIKVNQINFSKVFPVHPEILGFMLSKSDLEELYKKYTKYADEKDLIIFLDKGYMGFPEEYKTDISFSMGCRAGISQINVLSNGSVVGCKLLSNVIAGNIYKDNLETIWKEDKNWTLFRNTDENSEDKNCNLCKYFSACRGGCRAYTYYITGNFYKKDPLCPL